MQRSDPFPCVPLREMLPRARFFGNANIRVSSCSSDPRRCRDGDVFVAVQDANGDDHALADIAVQRGAVAVVAERLLPIDVPQCIVPDSREALGVICQQLAGRPSQRLRTIGVTGTNGKTITTELIAAVMRTALVRTGVLNTMARHDGCDSAAAARTTPDPVTLANWMRRMVDNDCGASVLEVSSRGLSEHRVAGIEFDAAVLTNLRRDHIPFHGSLQNYRRAKLRLFRRLKPEGFVVLNADDPYTQSVAKRLDHAVVTFGMRNSADVMGEVIERHAGEQIFLLTAGNETVAVQTNMFGDFHVSNCLAAASVGLAAGLDLTTVARGLESVSRIPGRMEPITCGQPFGVYVDYARTPDHLAVALRTLRPLTQGRLVCVYGVDAHCEAAQRPLMGRLVERYADLGIITTDNSRHTPPLELAHEILDGYDRPSRAHILPNRTAAIRWALAQAQPGDTVLIAGKGDQQTQIIGGQQCRIDDRQTARQCLSEKGMQKEYFEQLDHILPFPTVARSSN